MSSQQAAVAQATPRARALPWTFLSYLMIGLAALLPRVLNLGLFLSGDEGNFWLRRSETFLHALQAGDYAATAISTHPGVTTMWLGSAGIVLRRALFESGLLRDETFSTVLALMRLPTALIHVVGILLGYALLRRLLPSSVAVLSALLWASDPFIIGYSRFLHVDALAATFATLSLLFACYYWNHAPRPVALIGSGICAGLAFLSKSPALALLPAVGALALATTWRQPSSSRSLVRTATPLLLWGAISVATVFALWPALWVGPAQAFAQLRTGVVDEGAEPHMQGNFFLDRPDDAPGPLFYPVTLALRLTPWGLLGLLLLPLAWRRFRALADSRHDLAAMACFAVLFIVALSVFPKKFNRYLIPIWPLIDILAAAGLAWGAQSIGRLLQRRNDPKRMIAQRVSGALLGAVAALAILNAAWWHPYDIAYFNQALGGAQAGAHTFLIGWGEGFDQVADWLNHQDDITGVVTVSPMTEVLQPFMRRGAQVSYPDAGKLPNNAGYVVVYVRQIEDGELPTPFDQFYGHAPPLQTIRIHGVEYAWIYRAPPPIAQPRPADFGAAIHLRGFDQAGEPRRGQPLSFKLVWEPRATPAADYTLFAHLIGPDGQRYAQIDLPYPTGQWQPGQFVTTELPISIPAQAPAGVYHLFVGLYDPATGQRLALTGADARDPALDGLNAFLLTQLALK